jgi:hypothetical protein
VLEAKADAQARELALAEREVAEMTAEFRRAAATGGWWVVGVGSRAGGRRRLGSGTRRSMPTLTAGGFDALDTHAGGRGREAD